MNSEEENEDFLEPPSPHISQDIVKTKPSVPRPLTAWLLFSGLASIILCFIWVTVIGGYGGLNWENGTWHFVSMTTFLILTGVGASAFRIFTFVSRPVAKVKLSRFLFIFLSVMKVLAQKFSWFMQSVWLGPFSLQLSDFLRFFHFTMLKWSQICTLFTLGLALLLRLYLEFNWSVAFFHFFFLSFLPKRELHFYPTIALLALSSLQL